MASVPADAVQTSSLTDSAAGAPAPRATAEVVQKVMEQHFRSAAGDSKDPFSAAWRDANVSIRYLNHMSPLMLGIIQRPGTNASMEERKAALDFMIASTDALAKVMSDRLGVSPNAKAYDRVELNSMLSHLIGQIWEKSSQETQQARVDDFVRTVSGVFADPDFLTQREAHAELMMAKMGYQRVDAPETMQTRLNLAMHQATLRFFEGVADERLKNSKGLSFTYGQKKSALVSAMQADFAGAMSTFLTDMTFSPSLSNDQRTVVMQSWIRHASEIYRSEYVASTQRVMDWFRAGQSISQANFESRFAKASASLSDVLSKARTVTVETLSDLVSVAGFDGVAGLAAPVDQPQQGPNVGQ
jgi:hypothetical protein